MQPTSFAAFASNSGLTSAQLLATRRDADPERPGAIDPESDAAVFAIAYRSESEASAREVMGRWAATESLDHVPLSIIGPLAGDDGREVMVLIGQCPEGFEVEGRGTPAAPA